MRRFWLQVHLWLGLIAGSVLALIALTGSLLVFHFEIDAALNPSLLRAPQGAAITPGRALEAARNHAGEVAVLHLPHPKRPVFVAEIPTEAGAEELFIDAATGEIRGQRDPDRSLIGVIYNLHNALLLGANGELAVGWIGVAALLSLATGVYLWWPRKRKFRQALTLKPNAGPVRRNYDWHRVLGAWPLPIMLLIFLTGVYLAFPNTVSGLIDRVAPVTPMALPPASGPPAGRADIGADGAVAAAAARWPGAEVRAIYPPGEAVDAWLLTLQKPGDPRLYAASSGLAVDRYSGEVLSVVEPLEGTIGDVIVQWQYPLHTGEVFGVAGRVVVLLCGLLPPLMLVTGYRIWRAKAARRGASSSQESLK